MSALLLALLTAPGLAGAPPAADPDFALKMALGQSRGALHASLAAGSPFGGQVRAAFEGYENADEACERYLGRGRDLGETAEIVAAQLEQARGQLPGTAAALRRRAGEARSMIQLYLVLPRDYASAQDRPAERDLFADAMVKIAFDGDYAAAEARRIRAVERSRRPSLRP